jgi:hypothetical protein
MKTKNYICQTQAIFVSNSIIIVHLKIAVSDFDIDKYLLQCDTQPAGHQTAPASKTKTVKGDFRIQWVIHHRHIISATSTLS